MLGKQAFEMGGRGGGVGLFSKNLLKNGHLFRLLAFQGAKFEFVENMYRNLMIEYSGIRGRG